MKSWDELMQATAPVFTTTFGVPSEYTEFGKAARTIDAIIEDAGQEERDEDDGPVLVYRKRVQVLTDAADGVASPRLGDTIKIDGETYSFERFLERNSDRMHTLSFIRPVPLNKTRRGRDLRR